MWSDFWAIVWKSAKETPRQYFLPLIWLWKSIAHMLRGTKLIRCPQCGEKGKMVEHPYEDKYRVQCQSCNLVGKASCVKEVAKLHWNNSENHHQKF